MMTPNEINQVVDDASWSEHMERRAEAIGNHFSVHFDAQDIGDDCAIYERNGTIKASPFRVQNAYDRQFPECGHYGGPRIWSFPLFPDDAAEVSRQLIEKFIKLDEEIYQKWLEFGKPPASERFITVKDLESSSLA